MAAGDYKRCQTCGSWDWTGAHVCLPVFECVMEDDDLKWEGLSRIYARSADTAAEKFVERYEENGDGPQIACNEEEVIVLVRPADKPEEITRWEVRGWMTPIYSAEAAPDKDA